MKNQTSRYEGEKEANTMENIERSKGEVVQSSGSPDELIRLAINSGADLDKLEKLMTLKRQYEADEARKAYHKAMSDFKANPPKIDRDKTVKYKDVKYHHASLANVVEKITIELSKHGLSASWRTQQNGFIAVTCKITHVMGHSEETTLSAPADVSGSKNAIQAIGSTISYLERYSLLAVLGLATYDQDDDGKAATDEPIDESQLSNIVDMIAHVQADEEKFLAYLGVESLKEIPKSQYQKAINALKAKEKQVKK